MINILSAKPTRKNRSTKQRERRRSLIIEMLEDRKLLATDTESFWVYYGKGNTLYRSMNDGSQEQTLMSLSIQPGSVPATDIQFELDRTNKKIYAMATQGHNPIHLYRANLDGTGLELLNNSDSMGALLQGMAVNETTKDVYISPHHLQVRTPGSAPGGMLRVANNGQTVTQFGQKPWYVTDMEVDAANGHVYYAVWPSWCCNQTHGWAGIRRMNLDGSNDIGIVQTGGNGSFALDVANNQIWFSTFYSGVLQNNRIYSVSLDGTNLQDRLLIPGGIWDIDLSESKDHVVFMTNLSSDPNVTPLVQQFESKSLAISTLFNLPPNVSTLIELLSANSPPTVDPVSDLVFAEDSGQQLIQLSGITPGGSESQPVSISVSSSNPDLIPNPAVNFETARWINGGLYHAGRQTYDTETGDFNGDSIRDVAVVHLVSGDVAIYYGLGHGDFQQPIFWSVNSFAYSLAIADFNGDGLDDLAATNFESNRVAVRISTGNSFAALKSFPTGNGSVAPASTGADPIQAADFNNDGKLDLVVGNTRHHLMSVLLGDGSGDFLAPIVSSVDPSGLLPRPNQIGPRSLACADFNRDGKLDVAVGLLGRWEAGGDIPGDLRIMLGDGSGGFALFKAFESGQYTYDIVSADFNRDGIADLAISSEYNGGVYRPNIAVYFGKGDGDFIRVQMLMNLAISNGLKTADVNRDGYLDLVAFRNVCDFYPGTSSGSFLDPISMVSSSQSVNRGGALADFDKDGWFDIAWGVGAGNVVGSMATWLGRDNSRATLTVFPVSDRSGAATITISIEDGGIDGNLATNSDNGIFSRSFAVTVNPVNDAPTLDAISNLPINEDAPLQTVNLTGITAGPSESQPLRVTATSSNPSLIPSPSVSYTSTNTTGTISFAPLLDAWGTSTITVTVEDGGLDGNLATAADNATFSRSFTVTVAPVNDAPSLDASASPTLGTVLEGALDPIGITVAELIVDGSITDPDGPAVDAIAITGLNTHFGSWQYKLDGVSNWMTIDATLINSQTNELALLLGATARLRLVPFGYLNGSASDAITFRAWDRSIGVEGKNVIISETGGASAFSVAVDTASLNVMAVNDAPIFWNGDGKITTDFGYGEDVGSSIAIQPDGRILMGGYSWNGSNFDFALSRYLANGSLDSSFGSAGKVTTPIGGGGDVGQVVKVQADGKIVVCGYVQGGNNDFALVRYNADGTLDTTFGAGGKVTTAIGPGNENGYHLMIQPDGMILVAGFSFNGSNDDFALVRYNSNGSLDTDFGVGGKVTTGIGSSDEESSSLALQPDGKIVVGGSSYNSSTDYDFALIRYNSNGSLDTGFGNGGKVTTTIGANEDNGYDVKIQLDGKILLGGWSRNPSKTKNDFALLRFNSNGSLDNSFGTDGKVTTAIGPFEDVGWSIEVQPDNKILLGGYSWSGSKWDLALVRYQANGALDTGFGSGGKVTTAIGTGRDIGKSLVLQTDGKILLGGFSFNGVDDDFAFVRYNANGSLDATLNPVNSLGGNLAYTENGDPIVLDSDVGIIDADLSAANDFGGATLTLVRAGGPSAEDQFSAVGTLGDFSPGGNLVVGGTTIGTVTSNAGGRLVVTFNSNATNSLVNSAMRQIAYANSGDSPTNSVVIEWIFSDGNNGTQGTGGPLNATGSVTVTITAVNDSPSDLSLSSTSLGENLPDDSIVGTLSTTDTDGGNTFTYTLVAGTGDTDNGAFKIDGTTLRATNSFDYETKSSYSIRIRSTDQGGLFTEKVFNIRVLKPFWVYYGKGNTLYRSMNDGTQEQSLVSLSIVPGPVNADYIQFDLDRVSKKIYIMANQGHNPIHLYRANLDGTGLELLNNSDSMGALLQGISVNEITKDVYVSPHTLTVRTPGSAPGGMLRVSNDGQTVTQFSQKPWYVPDIEVDAANGHVYYSVWPAYGSVTAGWAGIRRMNLDGSGDVPIVETKGNSSFAIDTINNRIWFGANHSNIFQSEQIYSVALNGTDVQSGVLVSGYTFADIDLAESKDHVVVLGIAKPDNPNPNPRLYQFNTASLSVSSLFEIPNISAGIELLEANLLPTLDAISNIAINENSPLQNVNLTNITAGIGDSQPLRLTATSSNPSLIPNPTVAYTSPNTIGSLSFQPVANQFGTSTITVNVEDGGLDNDLSTPSDNASFSQSFVVTVNQRNELPVIALSPIITSLPENGSTPEGMVVADIVVTDDDRGTNSLFLSGPDSSDFQIISSVGGPRLQLVPDALLDYEIKPFLEVTVNVDDSSIGTTPDASVNYRLDITNVRDAVIVDRRIFYHRSLSPVFGNGLGNPNAAIDPSKAALLPGGQPTFSNYSNYVKGLNGLIIDATKFSPSVTVSDFAFATWNGIATTGFVGLSATPTITLFPGGGSFGSDRVKIEFPDDAIRNTWLRVTVLANANTDLASNDVFYFGNAVGEFNVGNLSGPPVTVRTNASDTSAVRQNQSIGANSAAVTNIYDINKDGRVNSADTSIVRQHQSGSLIRFFTAPASLQLALAPDETDTIMSNTDWLGELDSTTSRRRRSRLM
jgi:uncharacterized delta-60 repeat protein